MVDSDFISPITPGSQNSAKSGERGPTWQGPQPNGPSWPKLTPFSTGYALNDDILSHRLVFKLPELGLFHSIYFWIKNLLSYHSHGVRVGPDMSSALSLSTGFPQDCMLHTCTYTHNYTPAHSSINIPFADDTTVLGLISRGGRVPVPRWGVAVVGVRHKKQD